MPYSCQRWGQPTIYVPTFTDISPVCLRNNFDRTLLLLVGVGKPSSNTGEIEIILCTGTKPPNACVCVCVYVAFHILHLQKIYPIFYKSYSSVRRLTGLVLRITKNTDASFFFGKVRLPSELHCITGNLVGFCSCCRYNGRVL